MLLTYFHILGIIVAGGDWNKNVELFLPESGRTCKLPDLPSYYSFSTLDTFNGMPVMCGSQFGSSDASVTCIKLSPSSDKASWSKYLRLIEQRFEHTSWHSPEGLLLMGGNHGAGSWKSVEMINSKGKSELLDFSLKTYTRYLTLDIFCQSRFFYTLMMCNQMLKRN